MPSWGVHLYIAKKVNTKINMDIDSLLLGSLLPDVDRNMSITRHESHYYDEMKLDNGKEEYLANYNDFIRVYKNKLNNPIVVGYLIHLMSDYYFNKYFYEHYNCYENNKLKGLLIRGKLKEMDEKLCCRYRHYDYDLFGKKLFDKNLLPKDSINLRNNCKVFSFYTNENLDNRFKYLYGDFINKDSKLSLREKIFGYSLFSFEELEKVLNDCIKFINNELDNVL